MMGRYFGIPTIDACSLCEVGNASLTYTSAKDASSLANASSFSTSRESLRMFSSIRTSPSSKSFIHFSSVSAIATSHQVSVLYDRSFSYTDFNVSLSSRPICPMRTTRAPSCCRCATVLSARVSRNTLVTTPSLMGALSIERTSTTLPLRLGTLVIHGMSTLLSTIFMCCTHDGGKVFGL